MFDTRLTATLQLAVTARKLDKLDRLGPYIETDEALRRPLSHDRHCSAFSTRRHIPDQASPGSKPSADRVTSH